MAEIVYYVLHPAHHALQLTIALLAQADTTFQE